MSELRNAPAAATARPGDPPRARRACLLAALAILVAHFASFDISRQPIVTDVRYSLYFAAQTAQGAVPHRDFFDNRTQLSTFAGAGLYLLAQAAGTDPLLTIRAACLTFAALIGLLLFAIHRELAGGRCAAGLLGLLPYVGFTLLALLPSIGVFPKLLMTLLATAGCWAAYRERWLLAGACGALAAYDWQVGGLSLVAFACAALVGATRPRRACLHLFAGGLAVAVAVVGYLALADALEPAIRQVILAAFARGTSALEGETAFDRLARIVRVTQLGCPGHVWLALVGIAGIFVYPVWWRRHRRQATGRLVVAIGLYHLGMVAFSVLDFQLFGDLYALLQSAAFFAGVALVEALDQLSRVVARTRAAATSRWRTGLATVFVAVVAAAVWGSAGVPDVRLTDPGAAPTATLDDQRAVARAIRDRLGGGRLVVVGSAEILFLAPARSAARFVYWNAASYDALRSSPEETPRDALYRLIVASEPGAIVYPEHRLGHEERFDADFSPVEFVSPDGDYRITALLRRAS